MDTIRSFRNIVDNQEVRKLLNAFVVSTGLSATCISADGKTVIRPEAFGHTCEFCQLIWDCPQGRSRCMNHMLETGKLSMWLGAPYIARCHAGLVTFSAPIVYERDYIGSVNCGPMMMWDWDEMALEEILHLTSDLPIKPEAVAVASQTIKVYKSRDVQAMAELLYVLVGNITHSGMETLEQRRQINEQQMKLAQVVSDRKQEQEDMPLLGREYPIHREQEMLIKVKLGDRTGAREILNELLGDVFFRSGGSLEIMKARILELVVVISRAAVEGGAALDHLLGMNYHYISELAAIDVFEDMCHWVVSVLDTFMDAVYASRNVKNTMNLGEALRYIRERYAQGITLEDVAGHVHISPFYLSHLFREELGTTYVEYLTQVRMEQARSMLRGTPLPISEVAMLAGYEDSSYFCKVFKRNVGVTPNQYRKIQ